MLAEQVYDGETYKPFAEMTVEEVETRAAELRGAAGFGPTQRVAAVAAVWEGLADVMRRDGAARSANWGRTRCWRGPIASGSCLRAAASSDSGPWSSDLV